MGIPYFQTNPNGHPKFNYNWMMIENPWLQEAQKSQTWTAEDGWTQPAAKWWLHPVWTDVQWIGFHGKIWKPETIGIFPIRSWGFPVSICPVSLPIHWDAGIVDTWGVGSQLNPVRLPGGRAVGGLKRFFSKSDLGISTRKFYIGEIDRIWPRHTKIC